MFKIGDKAKGFKFDGDKYYSLRYAEDMDNATGVVGVLTYVGDESYSVKFGEQDFWGYPNDLWHPGKVEEEVIPSFTVGDRVKFKKSSIDTGMIDATEDDVFTILYVEKCYVMLKEQGYWWNVGHFEHVKENIVNNTEEENIQQSGNYVPKIGDKAKGFKFSTGVTPSFNPSMSEYIGQTGKVSDFLEDRFKITFDDTASWYYPLSLAHLAKIEETQEEQEIDWEVGQEVWDVRYGKGVVDTMIAIPYQYPIGVVFADGGTASYTSKWLNRCTDVYRSLFFSEPKIEAEKFPPKKLFVPALKKDDVVIIKVVNKLFGEGTVRTIYSEIEDRIYISTDGEYFLKKDIESIHILSEEIKFN